MLSPPVLTTGSPRSVSSSESGGHDFGNDFIPTVTAPVLGWGVADWGGADWGGAVVVPDTLDPLAELSGPQALRGSTTARAEKTGNSTRTGAIFTFETLGDGRTGCVFLPRLLADSEVSLRAEAFEKQGSRSGR